MEKNKISEKKLFMMLTIELFAMTSLILPAVLVGFSGKNGLPVLLFASGLFFLLAFFYKSFPEKYHVSPDSVLRKTQNLFFKNGIRFIYILRFFIHGLFLMIVFVNLIKEVLLPDYDLFWILVPILILTYLTWGKPLRVRGRILEVIFPYIFVPLLFVLCIALFQVDYASLPEQLWAGEGGRKVWLDLYSSYGVLMFYQPVEFLLFLLPSLSKKAERKKRKVYVTGAACLLAVMINILMYVVAVLLFGTVRVGKKLWSSLYIMQSVRLPGHFVERLDILFLVFWIFSVFALFSAYMYYGGRFISERKEKRYAVFWLVAIGFFVLAIKEPRPMFEFFVPYKMWIDFPLSVLLPFLLYGKRKNKEGKSIWKTKRVRKLFYGFILCVLCLTGCRNRADIEDKNYVMTMGIERGEEKAFRITYEMADLSSSDKEEKKKKARIVSYEADSLKESEQIDGKRADKKLDLGHLKCLLFSDAFLKDSEGKRELFKELADKDSIAGTTPVLFTEEKVDKIIDLGSQKASSFGEYVDGMLAMQKNERKDSLSLLLRDIEEGEGIRRTWFMKEEKNQLVLFAGKASFKEEDALKEQQREREISSLEKKNEPLPDIVRFHIRADNDSSEAQNKKVQIKDRVLPKIQGLLSGIQSKEECMERLIQSVDLINQWAEEACREEEYKCKAKTYVCQESFPLKSYGNILLPSGTYDALRIDLGRAEGANWWCMMYPSLCLMDDCVGRLDQDSSKGKENESEKQNEISEEDHEADKAEEEEGIGIYSIRRKKPYRIRWKISEWIKEIMGR